MPSSSKNAQVYIGNLPKSITKEEINRMFKSYGTIKEISIKNRFAFVDYADSYEAEKAIKKMNGYSNDGEKLTVELARLPGERRRRSPRRRSDSYHRSSPY